jgi:cell division protein FtsL
VPDVDFEYAIKMDVRNNPIVREIDRTRQRELWRSAGIGIGLVAVVLFSLWQRFSVMRLGAEIESMQRALAEEREVNAQLRLEVGTLSSPPRIEAIASRRPLQMTLPDQARTLILERATAAPAPERAVEARQRAVHPAVPRGPGVRR